MSKASSIEELSARLARLEDERAIAQTLHRYGQAIDYGREQDWADCFTEDGVFDVRTRSGEPFVRCEGRKELLAMASGHTRPPTAYHKHLVVAPIIELDGDTARVESFFARLDADDEGGHAYVRAMGRYRDRFVRCPDGVWRIRIRLAQIEDR